MQTLVFFLLYIRFAELDQLAEFNENQSSMIEGYLRFPKIKF